MTDKDKLIELEKELVEAEQHAIHRRNDGNESSYDMWEQIRRVNDNMWKLIQILKET